MPVIKYNSPKHIPEPSYLCEIALIAGKVAGEDITYELKRTKELTGWEVYTLENKTWVYISKYFDTWLMVLEYFHILGLHQIEYLAY